MSRISYENYGKRAARPLSYTEIAGRYPFQRQQEKAIVRDVAAKLLLGPTDDLLEVGCGAGNLIIPLAKRVRSAAGVDHPELLARLRHRPDGDTIRLYRGNFLDLVIKKRFSKILVYSVIHYLSSREEVLRFLDKAMAMLAPGGMMLVGDIPNVDKKRRFQASQKGKRLQREWEQQVAEVAARPVPALPPDHESVAAILNDEMLLSFAAHFRTRGCEAYLLGQPDGLCFAYTREDLLVTAPPR